MSEEVSPDETDSFTVSLSLAILQSVFIHCSVLKSPGGGLIAKLLQKKETFHLWTIIPSTTITMLCGYEAVLD